MKGQEDFARDAHPAWGTKTWHGVSSRCKGWIRLTELQNQACEAPSNTCPKDQLGRMCGDGGRGGGSTREYAREGNESPNNLMFPCPQSQGNIPCFPEPLSIKGLTVLGEGERKTKHPPAPWSHR